MRRLIAVLTLPLAIAACRIESTPDHYINRPADTAVVTEAESEIRSRLSAIAAAIQRGDVAELALSLGEGPNLAVVGSSGTEILDDVDEVAAELVELTQTRSMIVREVETDVAPRDGVAWFRLELVPTTSPDQVQPVSGYRFTGVFLEVGGEWSLVQGHISRPVTDPLAPVEDSLPAAAERAPAQ